MGGPEVPPALTVQAPQLSSHLLLSLYFNILENVKRKGGVAAATRQKSLFPLSQETGSE